MNHDYEKKWFEGFAKELLETIFPLEYNNLILSDKPDIRMGNSHGIEVTRSFYDNTAEIEHLYCKVESKNIDELDANQNTAIERIEKLGGQLFIDSTGIIRGIMPFKKAVVINADQIVEALLKKEGKYDNYSDLGEIDLFVFAPNPFWFDKSIISSFFDSYGPDSGYNKIFVYCHPVLYRFEKNSPGIEEITVTKAQYESCSQYADGYARMRR